MWCSNRVATRSATYLVGPAIRVLPRGVARGNPRPYGVKSVELAPVGSVPVAPFGSHTEFPPDPCLAPWSPWNPTGLLTPSFGRGLRGNFSTDRLHALGLSCQLKANPGVQSETVVRQGTLPSSSPAVLASDCRDGKLLVGVRGYTKRLRSERGRVGIEGGEVITALSPRCLAEADIEARSTSPSYEAFVGPRAEGTAFDRVCPPGMAVKAVGSITAAEGLAQVRMLCQDVAEFRSLLVTEAPSLGWSSGAVEMCAPQGAPHQLFGQGASGITRLGALCSPVTRDVATGDLKRVKLPVASAVLSAHGSLSHTSDSTAPSWDSSNACSDDEVMVGLAAKYSGHRWGSIGGLRPVCANVANRGAGGTATRMGGSVSDSGEPDATSVCPTWQLMAGWRIVATDVVWGVTPLCRQF